MDDETKRMIKEICSMLTGNTYDTLTKDDYKILESLALYVGHDKEIINA